MTIPETTASTTTWADFFATVKQRNLQLLSKLDEFPHSVLVTGCQRSGTTMLARLITNSRGMTNYWFGQDDELDAALILSGQIDHRPQARYCFQTTYINERYREYYEHSSSHQFLWILRNPYSVVYSMLYNWKDWALNLLFRSCGLPAVSGIDRWRYRAIGMRSFSRLRRACWAYTGKVSQLFKLRKHLGDRRIMVVDYDDLVTSKCTLLPQIYRFIDLEYHSTYGDGILRTSLAKRFVLTKRETMTIDSICDATYQRALELAHYCD